MIGPQQFDSMTKADAARFDDPVDHRTTRLAGAETVPQVLLRRHHQRRLAIVMKRTAADQVRAVTLQLDAETGDQVLDRDFLL